MMLSTSTLLSSRRDERAWRLMPADWESHQPATRGVRHAPRPPVLFHTRLPIQVGVLCSDEHQRLLDGLRRAFFDFDFGEYL